MLGPLSQSRQQLSQTLQLDEPAVALSGFDAHTKSSCGFWLSLIVKSPKATTS